MKTMMQQSTSLRCGSAQRVPVARALPSRPCARPAVAPRAAPASTSSRRSVRVSAGFAPPTVGDTKKRFFDGYKKPIPAIYSTVVQELLVQMHFVRYGVNYEYNEIYALGFTSVFDQVLETLDEAERKAIFASYVKALNESPEQYRKDAQALEQQAGALSGPEGLTADAAGTTLQKALAKLNDRSAAGKLAYNKFIAIGLFRLLELTGAKEPAALERLVKTVGVKPEAVNRDLMLYKGILSKLSAAKELMREFTEREKRKQAEREAEKAAKAAGNSSGGSGGSSVEAEKAEAQTA